MICIPLLALFISGGNFTTALLTAVLLAGLLIASLVFKRFHPLYALTFLVFLGGLFVSVLAPGNAIRQQYCAGAPAFDSIIGGILASVTYARSWTRLPLIVLGLFAAPFAFRAAQGTSFRFRLPMLVTVGSFALLSVGFVPPIYGMSTPALGRLLNIQYDLFVLLFFLNVLYYAGWLQKRLPAVPLASLRRYMPLYVLLFVLLFGIACFPPVINAFSSALAYKSLINGNARRFDEELTARIETHYLSDDPVVEVPRISVQPEILFAGDVTTDPSHYINTDVALYYGKERVTLAPAPSDR